MILRMIAHDIVRFFLVYSAVLVGFSQAIYVVHDGRVGPHALFLRMRTLLVMGFTGEVNYDDNYGSGGRMNPLTQVLVLCYVVLVMIILVNLLIAIPMGNVDVPLAYLPIDPINLADPFTLVKQDMVNVNDSIKRILGSDHPVLAAVARYFFEHDGGKKVRPTMVLLVARAAEAHRRAMDTPLPETQSEEYTHAAQQRLAEITEMIHTASLMHDDVIDEADTRRGRPSVNKVFGGKMAVLAGDFLLARSSVSLARLRNLEAVELMSTSIEHLVKGEVMQMKNADARDDISPFEYYLRKNYYKTGSLMSNSCKAALVLGKHDQHICDLGFAFGRHIGLAFQLIDDVLDYEGVNTGKPLLADLKSGLSTAPLLLAQEEFPVLRELSKRKFAKEGDIEMVCLKFVSCRWTICGC
ncbi:Folylpolyglutamate synthase [Phytophthora nicotianae]|uniref:Folylpolyglutamate synthase n=1 Tax=Phytophthora nicotianae TaxID=4792 RepID=A0A0W8DR39_PHYNI|nr:Folylpolyglutamate synthase [Phytophthora nicotianae]